MRTIYLTASDGAHMAVYDRWVERPRAVVQILHGMGEHAGRYQRLAHDLNQAGFATIAHDHRGHGPIAQQTGSLSSFGQGGWKQVIADVAQVNQYATERDPQLPVVMLGHSMGSFIAQSAVGGQRVPVDALVLSGSTLSSPLQLKMARSMARIERRRLGPLGQSGLLRALSTGAYGARFKPCRTDSDWLSRDPEEVDAFIADPLCGTPTRNDLWVELFGGLLSISSKAYFSNFPRSVPLYVLGGADDPVGGKNGLSRLTDAYRGQGVDVTLKIYPQGRHEMFNETNRDEVTEELIEWLTGRFS